MGVYPIKAVFPARVSHKSPACKCSYANLKKAVPLRNTTNKTESTPALILPKNLFAIEYSMIKKHQSDRLLTALYAISILIPRYSRFPVRN